MEASSGTADPRPEWTLRHRITLAVILVAALGLRATGLDESVWFDELWSTHVRLESPFEVLMTGLRDNHPPAYTAFIYLWTLVFGDGEIAIRLPSLFAGLATIAITAHLGRELLSPWTGLVAAALLAISPPQIWYAQEARHYTPLLMMVTGAALAAVRVLRDGPTPWRTWLFAGCLWSALFMHYFAVAYAGVALLATFRRRTEGERRLFWSTVIGLAAVVAFFVIKASTGMLRTSSPHLRPFGPLALWLTWFGWFPSGHAIWRFSLWDAGYRVFTEHVWMTLSHLVLAGSVALGAVAAWRRASAPHLRGWIAIPLAVPALLVALALVGHTGTFIERGVLTDQPFVYLLLAAGVTSLPRLAERVAVGLAVSTVAVAGTIAFLASDETTVHKPNPDWRTAAQKLLAEPEVPSVILTASPSDALAYYGREFRVLRAGDGKPGRLESKAIELGLARCAPDGPARFPMYRFGEYEDRLDEFVHRGIARVYVIENRVWRDRVDDVHAWMSARPRFEPRFEIHAAHLRIRVYEARR